MYQRHQYSEKSYSTLTQAGTESVARHDSSIFNAMNLFLSIIISLFLNVFTYLSEYLYPGKSHSSFQKGLFYSKTDFVNTSLEIHISSDSLIQLSNLPKWELKEMLLPFPLNATQERTDCTYNLNYLWARFCKDCSCMGGYRPDFEKNLPFW